MIPEELYENEPYKVEQVDENGKTVTVLTGPNGWRTIHRDVRDGGLNLAKALARKLNAAYREGWYAAMAYKKKVVTIFSGSG
jgi:hypothetical protein